MSLRSSKRNWVYHAFVIYTIQCLYISDVKPDIDYGNDCGSQIRGSLQGIIKSPGYPSSGLTSADCHWEIQNQPGGLISIYFEDFDLEEGDFCIGLGLCCTWSWLKIGTIESEPPIPFCGRNKPLKPYVSTNPVVWIKYHTAVYPHSTARGFNLSYVITHHQFPQSCQMNETKCHPKSLECHPKCDHIMHCANGADEMGCVKGCSGRIMCDSWKGCYMPDERCNGITECGDHSDERNCNAEMCRTERGGFLCNNRQCIRESWQCDQTNDCGDDSDEMNCLKSSVITAAIMGSLICGLLLVVAVGCTCKLYALRYGESSGSTRSTLPLSPLERELLSREPPPPYSSSVSQSAGSYCLQGGSSHLQQPSLLDPLQFARICRSSHHRRGRCSRRTRRRPRTPPPPCLLVVPHDITNSSNTGDSGVLNTGDDPGANNQHSSVPEGHLLDSPGHLAPSEDSRRTDKCGPPPPSQYGPSTGEDVVCSAVTPHAFAVIPPLDCMVNYFPVVSSEVQLEDDEDDDDRPLLIA